MSILKKVLGVAALGAIVMAFRDVESGGWLRPALPRLGEDDNEDFLDDQEEPVLGYDGMDRDTLLDWLGDADLDGETLLRIERYERANLAREPVLDALAALAD